MPTHLPVLNRHKDIRNRRHPAHVWRWRTTGLVLPGGQQDRIKPILDRQMKRTIKTALFAVMAAALVVIPQNVMAQGRGQRGQGGPGQGGFGGFDPEQMRQRMMERYQEQLGASAEEMKVIGPLITDVMEKQRAASGSRFGGMMGMMRGPRGGGPGGDQQGDDNNRRRPRFGPEPDPAVAALQEAIESNAPAAELKAKIAAVQAAREKAQSELDAAKKKLRAVLTTKQEAQLVLAGTL
jgi:hypothetical protein